MTDTEKLANQALTGADEKEAPKIKMLYEQNSKKFMAPLGIKGFEPTQIDTLGFVPLGEKVLKILGGQMEFHADDNQLEYDQDEGEWSDDDPDFDPTNQPMDKTDLFDLQKETLEKIAEAKVNASHATKVEPGDTPTDTVERSKSEEATDKKGD